MIHFFNFDELEFSNSLKLSFQKIYDNFLKRFNFKNYDLEVSLVSEEEMKHLNFEYRGKYSSTDVLSFPLNPQDFENMLGSLFFCYADVKKNNINVESEFNLLFSHGILHLIGYDHSEEMFNLQEELLGSI